MLHGPGHRRVTSSSHRQKQTQVPMEHQNLQSGNRMSPKSLSLMCQWGVLSISHPLHLPSRATKPTQHRRLANPITRVSIRALQQDRINPTDLRQS